MTLRHIATTLLAVGASASAGAGTGAQAPVKLQTPVAVVDATFNRIGGIRELPNRHLLVVDQTDKQVWDVDANAKTRALAGASGTGPLDYQSPFVLFPAGPITMVNDFANRKFLSYSAAAKPVEAIPVDSLFPREVRRRSPRFGGADAEQRLYFELPAITVDATTGAHASDSAAILRVDRRRSRTDTIAFLHLPPGSIRASGGRPGEGMSVTTGADNPFAPHPAWAVAEDGRVAIVHADPYHVEWIDRNGVRREGPTIAYERIPVTEADKSGGRSGISASVGIGGVGARGNGSNVQPNGGRDDWPAVKAPFMRGDVRMDARGRVWVRRASRVGDATASYDVFDRAGRLVARFVLPERSRIVAVGASAVYAAKATDDGERLEMFRLPP